MPRGACPFSPGRAWPVKGGTRRTGGLPPSSERRGRGPTGRTGRRFVRGGSTPGWWGGRAGRPNGRDLPSQRNAGPGCTLEGGVPESDETRGAGCALMRGVPDPRPGHAQPAAPTTTVDPLDKFEDKASGAPRAASARRPRRHPPVMLRATTWGLSLLGPDSSRAPGMTLTQATYIPPGAVTVRARTESGPRNNLRVRHGSHPGAVTVRTRTKSDPRYDPWVSHRHPRGR